MRLIYLSHPEVEIAPEVPVPDWGLSATGRARLAAALAAGWPQGVARVAASAERKAREAAGMIAQARGLPVQVHPGLGEIDRSATGYVPHDRHEALADRLFARPDLSAEGWETALAAQARALAALREVLAAAPGDLLVVGHGGVGTLIWCALAGVAIDRRHDQPRGGCLWLAMAPGFRPAMGWQPLERMF